MTSLINYTLRPMESQAAPVSMPSPTEPRPKKLLEQVRDAIRRKHYSPRTEQSYINWIKRFIFYHGKRHPDDMGAKEVEAFLTHLAVLEHVAASTQNQAFSAILFLYREVRHEHLQDHIAALRAKKPKPLPVVLSKEEVISLIRCITAPLLCHPSAGKRLRHPHGAGVAGAQGRENDDDLHPRHAPWRTGGAQST